MRKGVIGVVVVAAVLVGGLVLALVDETTISDPPAAGAAALETYGSCDALLDEIQAQALERVGPYGLEDGYYGFAEPANGLVTEDGGAEGVDAAPRGIDEESTAASPTTTTPAAGGDGEGATSFSTTNVQEEGVDEADLVKTDGERLVTVVDGTLRVLDVTGDEPAELGSVPIPGTEADGPAYLGGGGSHDLLVSGDTALVLGQAHQGLGPEPRPAEPLERTQPVDPTEGDDGPPEALSGPLTQLVEVDLSEPAAPEVVRTAHLEGAYTSARMVGSVARIVAATGAPDLGFVYPSGNGPDSEAVAEQANRDLIEASTIEEWLPEVVVDDATPQPAVACSAVGVPAEPSGFGTASVTTVDLAEGLTVEPDDGAAVLGGSDQVYASTENLYVATVAWPAPDEGAVGPGEDVFVAPPAETDVHRFSLPGDGPATYEASGTVPGRMLDQFSFSEHDGALRVATTVDEAEGSVSQVTTFAVDDLTELGHVGDIARGEELFAVRMLGDVGYAVTFERTDPLFTLDLADPANPQVVGELEIPGYSSYLHPVSDELLIGVGQDGTEDGVLTGTQLSLFDVSDPANPQRLHKHAVAGASSEAEYDHRAFLWWPDTDLAVVPVEVYGAPSGTVAPEPFIGAIGLSVAPDGIDEVGRVSHGDPAADLGGSVQIRRSLVVGDHLLTVSDLGVQQADLATLEPTGGVTFS